MNDPNDQMSRQTIAEETRKRLRSVAEAHGRERCTPLLAFLPVLPFFPIKGRFLRRR